MIDHSKLISEIRREAQLRLEGYKSPESKALALLQRAACALESDRSVKERDMVLKTFNRVVTVLCDHYQEHTDVGREVRRMMNRTWNALEKEIL